MPALSALPQFICPICQSPLIMGTSVWQCTASNQLNLPPRHHSFDVAKQRYINLLPVQQKKSKQPGDSEASVLARQRFLQAGFYKNFADTLLDFCQRNLQDITHLQISDLQAINWLDIGCGEGYYTEQFLNLNPTTLIAMDISKPAILATTKRLKAHATTQSQIIPLVATASQMPLADSSVTVISSIFSPILPEEFSRLLSDGGYVFIAKPAAHHLIELRQALFDTVIEHDSDKFIEQMADKFSLINSDIVTNNIVVNAENLADLLTMTPYSYRAKPEKRQALLTQVAHQGEMAITVAFVVYGFRKLNLEN